MKQLTLLLLVYVALFTLNILALPCQLAHFTDESGTLYRKLNKTRTSRKVFTKVMNDTLQCERLETFQGRKRIFVKYTCCNREEGKARDTLSMNLRAETNFKRLYKEKGNAISRTQLTFNSKLSCEHTETGKAGDAKLKSAENKCTICIDENAKLYPTIAMYANQLFERKCFMKSP